MIIAEITAGLGNQLFQYANAKRIAIAKKQNLKLDLKFYETWKNPDYFRLDKFNTNYTIANNDEINFFKRVIFSQHRIDIRILIKILNRKLFKNNKYHIDCKTYKYDKKKLNKRKNLYLSGYWGNEKYFKNIETIIRNEFTLKSGLNLENQKIQNKIRNSNSISLHIRRGDYVNNPFFAEIPLDYYRKAIDYIESFFPNSIYFIFSDDLNWARHNIKIDNEINFVDANNAKTDYMDLILMSHCKHNIIANSTFSWWGAWLNENPDKIVIAPAKWYEDKKAQRWYEKGFLVPPEWIKV